MEQKQPEKVRDITLATLLFVISLFPAVFAWKMSNRPDILTFFLIYVSILASHVFAGAAKNLFFGMSKSDE